MSIIRKVELSVDEQIKFETIKNIVDHGGNKQRAALKLNMTVRHINRLIQAYQRYGKAAFVHGNRGRKPSTTTTEDIRASVVDLYRTKYYEANFTHYTELLAREEKIKL